MAFAALAFSPVARLLSRVSRSLLETTDASFCDHVRTLLEPWSRDPQVQEHLEPLFALLSHPNESPPPRRALASALQDSIENAAPSLEGEQSEILRRCYERLNEIAGGARTWPVSGFQRRPSHCHETRESVFRTIGGAVHDAKNTITVLSTIVELVRRDRPEILNLTLGAETIDQALAAIEEQTRGEKGLLKLVGKLMERIDSMREVPAPSVDDLKGLLLSSGESDADVAKIYRQLVKIQAVLRLIRKRMLSVQASNLNLFEDVERCIRLTKFSTTLFRGLIETHRAYDDKPMPISLQECLTAGMVLSIVGKHVDVGLSLASTWKFLGSPLKVWQLILNLAGNASRAMNDEGRLDISTRNMELLEGAGPRHHHKTISAISGGDYVVIEVGDTGPGIPFEKLSGIFELFHSGADSSGYGLALVMDIVHELGGFVGVDSSTQGPLNGATFYLYLPRAVTIPQTASTHSG